MSKSLVIVREYLPTQTLGRMIVIENIKKRPAYDCACLELPDLDNQQNISCIPEGTYPCKKMISATYGPIIAVNEVPGRDLIRIHPGNWTWDTRGCLLPGREHLFMDGDNLYDVNYSRNTLDDLLKILPREFNLHIVGA